MPDVYIGGVQGFDVLATASASALLRATDRVGLYMHANGITNAYADNTLGNIVQAFSNTGPGFAELPDLDDPANWFSTFYNKVFTQSGLAPSVASVDVPSYTIDATAWSAYVAAANAAGISRIAPIFSPNDANDPLGNFATIPDYASLRAAALSGGGITLDTPPGYALQRGSAYLQTIETEIQWARANGLTATVILSPTPGDYDSSFLQDTARFIGTLAAANALPDAWVVETYSTDGTTVVGSETDPQSIAGVALWLAQNADTPSSIAAASNSLTWTSPVNLAVGGAAPLSTSGSGASSTPALTINDSGGQAYVAGSAGGLKLTSSGANDQVWTASGATDTVTTGANATVDSRGNDTLAVGTGSSVLVEGNATISGGAGSSYYQIAGTATMLSQSASSDTIQTNAGSSLNLTVTGNYFNLFDSGSNVRVAEQSGGDNNVASLAGGGATLYGGAGHGLTVVTNAGMSTAVTLGAGGVYLASNGTDTITGGSGNATVVLGGTDTVTGGSGSSYFVVSGTSTLLSQSANSDVIQTNNGAHLNLTVTGHYFTLFDSAASVHVAEQSSGDNNIADLTGGAATVYGGAGRGLTIVTTAGQATQVSLGAGSVYLAANGTDTIGGGAGNNTLILNGADTVTGSTGSSYYDVLGTSTLLSQSANSDVIQTNNGAHLNLTVTGHYFTLFDSAATVHVAEQSSGDNNVADLTGGAATVYGGAGRGLTIVTTAGQATQVSLGAGSVYLAANGTDTIGGGAGNNTLILNGADTVTGSTGSSYYDVLGTSTLLSQSANADVIQTNNGAHLNLTVTGHYFTLFDSAATVHVAEQSSGDNNTADLTGGAATVYGGAGRGLTIVTTANQATQVSLGAGSVYLAANGTDTIGGGAGNNILILNGADTVTGSTGSSYYDVLGTSTLLSQSANADVIQTNNGAHLNLTVTGHYFTLFDSAATVHVAEQSNGDNNVADLTGGAATVYGGAGRGLTIVTTAGQATQVSLGAGSVYLAANGTDTIGGGAGNNTLILNGADTVTGSTGSSYYDVLGTSTLLSQSTNSDVIQTNNGAHLNLTVTGHYFTLFDSAATVHVAEQSSGDNNVADITGGAATIYGGAGRGLTIVTTAGQATQVSLGAGSVYLAANGTDTVGGGAGNNTLILNGADTVTGSTGSSYYDVLGTSTLLSQSANADVIQTNNGAHLNLTVTGHYFTLFDSAASVHVAEQSSGDNNVADITGGAATIYGGAGRGLTIVTTAGQATQVSLGAGSVYLAANGTDTIGGGAGNNTLILNGADTVTGSTGSSYYDVLGTSTLLSQSTNSDVIQTNNGAHLNLTVTGHYFTLFDSAATVHVAEQSSGDNNVADITGGAATIYGGAGRGLTIVTTANQATQVSLGAGNALVAANGNDTVTGNTAANTFIINGNATLLSQSASVDTVQTTASANATVNVTGAGISLTNAGGTVAIHETGGVDNAYVGLSGGQATVTGGAGQGLATTTAAGAITQVTVGAGNSVIHSNGQDTIFGGSGTMTFIGGAGAATVTGVAGALLIEAGAGNLTVHGSSGGDTLHAGTGIDTFYLGNGANTAYLGAGNATITGGTGANAYHIQAGTGARTVEITNYNSGRDSYDFSGFSGAAVTNQSVSNNTLTMTLSDGAHLVFDGVNHTM